ncbi:hypothetical protein N665_5926s0002 [Sinapis alba]|nr:hypothetical protein N665_5926s0002 [Sinapis alba]
MIHILISAAYIFLSCQVFHIYDEFVKDPLSNVVDYTFIACFWFGLVEFQCRLLLRIRNENPQLASKIRHLMHILVIRAHATG